MDPVIAQGARDLRDLLRTGNEREIPYRPALPLDPDVEADLWQRAQPLLNEPLGPMWDFWFRGTADPASRWFGYKIGTHLVRTYLERNAGVTAADLVATPTAEILENSGFDPKPVS